MRNDARAEYFQSPSLLGNLLRRLHVDIPLFLGLLMIGGLSFVILYSAGGQDMQVLIRHASRMSLAVVLMIVLAHVNPKQMKALSPILFAGCVLLLVAVARVLQDQVQELDQLVVIPYLIH